MFEGQVNPASGGVKKQIRFSLELNSLPQIQADPEQLMQVFTNLILNAIQAMPGGGKLTVNSGQCTVNSGQRTAKDKSVEVNIIDTGVGIEGDDLKNIFDPFFSKWPRLQPGMGVNPFYPGLAPEAHPPSPASGGPPAEKARPLFLSKAFRPKVAQASAWDLSFFRFFYYK